MDELLDEVVDEATGASPRRWALLLLVAVVGGVVALWLSKRARRAGSDAGSDVGFVAEVAGSQAAEPMAAERLATS